MASACKPPGSVTLSKGNYGEVKVTWTAGQAGTDNPITGYYLFIFRSDGLDFFPDKDVTVSASARTYTFTNVQSWAATERYHDYMVAIKTVGTVSNYDSSYVYVKGLPIWPPKVSAGDIIYDEEMDHLRWFLGGSQTDIEDETKVLASEGNTYKSGLTAGTSKITAAWYNQAIGGT